MIRAGKKYNDMTEKGNTSTSTSTSTGKTSPESLEL